MTEKKNMCDVSALVEYAVCTSEERGLDCSKAELDFGHCTNRWFRTDGKYAWCVCLPAIRDALKSETVPTKPTDDGRRVVGSHTMKNDLHVVVLDDGAVFWAYAMNSGPWYEGNPIPGTVADRRKL